MPNLKHLLLVAAGTPSVLAVCVQSSRAQAFDQFISPYLPGYSRGEIANIAARPQTEYDALGVRVGDFIIRPRLDESVGYNSNVLGLHPSSPSWFIGTAPQVDINSDYGRNSIGTSFGLNNQDFLDQKQQSRTDWNASVGGSFEIGRDKVNISASEIYSHQVASDIDVAAFNQPIGFKVTDVKLSYVTSMQRLQFEPNFEYIGYRFDNTVVPLTTLSQKTRDRDVVVGGLTIRYGDAPERSGVLVLQGTNSHYIAALDGGIRSDSFGYEALVGFHYGVSGKLQTLVLVGYEVRRFVNSVYPARASPVAQVAAVYQPSGLTTLTLRASRTIEDSIGETTTGVTLSQGSFTVDHEYLRNVILEGRASALNAEYGQGIGHQNIFDLGASATYLFNRNLRVTAAYDLNARTGSSSVVFNQSIPGTGNFTSSPYTNHVGTVTVRFSL